MSAQHAQTTFLWGFGLGLAASALLFYIWHTESLIQLQQEWLSQQQQQQQQTQRSVKNQLETIDLLMKSYSISDGTEDQDMRHPQTDAQSAFRLFTASPTTSWHRYQVICWIRPGHLTLRSCTPHC